MEQYFPQNLSDKDILSLLGDLQGDKPTTLSRTWNLETLAEARAKREEMLRTMYRIQDPAMEANMRFVWYSLKVLIQAKDAGDEDKEVQESSDEKEDGGLSPNHDEEQLEGTIYEQASQQFNSINFALYIELNCVKRENRRIKLFKLN